MKTVVCAGLLALTGAGCLPMFVTKSEPVSPPTVTTSAKAPPPPVTVDQVTPENAHEIADALWQELDREGTR